MKPALVNAGARRGEVPKGANCQGARTAEGRRLPKGANCRSAQTAEARKLPKGANCRRALSARAPTEQRRTINHAKRRPVIPLGRLAPLGSSRLTAVRAVWEFAPYGSLRRMAVRAVQQFAPPWQSAPFSGYLLPNRRNSKLPTVTRSADPLGMIVNEIVDRPRHQSSHTIRNESYCQCSSVPACIELSR